MWAFCHISQSRMNEVSPTADILEAHWVRQTDTHVNYRGQSRGHVVNSRAVYHISVPVVTGVE